MININNKNDLTDKYTKFLIRHRLSVNKENKCLSHIYWLPKFHRNPTKAQFIIAAPKCSQKQLSKSTTVAFKILLHQIESYNRQSLYFWGSTLFVQL